MSDIQQIVDFTALINHDLFHDKRDGQCSCRIVEDQLKKGHTKQELYDFIYGMDYIIPFFQLKMNDKPLSSLSPGERGALLLLLYLFIDMDDKPLIIDQPEENLDNESVFRNPNVADPALSGEMLLHSLREGDTLLVKASRGAAAERVIAYLRENVSRLCN